ncbi:ATP-dependent helicase HrpB [Thiomicrorhabdus sp. zzn3]|uniref:ATP-dependent helicase HrpB n=1 Tax=Thiomicrorhabdus sp. zzn3 TaxID=3039775 RepID=UPI00243669DF|nr:ATP-dependent helicase HrpB [Thiomicrorhabdus sp. zzn3]MDG6778163.1 ATP-dependent helicase HrpB [Thiomicrorhabdus sp. zzn3]
MLLNNLPITPLLPKVMETLEAELNVVLQADPGAGKSTAVPLAILLSDWFQKPENRGKKIIMLEPRRLAVRSIARYLARQLDEKVGERIGYQVRNERVISKQTQLEIVTEGILTRRIQSDPELSDVALVIFDEFHERSLHADLALSLCVDIQSALRDDLKLLVMSATIDSERVSRFLNEAPVLRSQGRSYPVETHYATQPVAANAPFRRELLPLLMQTVVKAYQNSQKDMLVFLPGQGEIMQAQQALLERFKTEQACSNANAIADVVVLPLYGGLKPEQQDAAILPDAHGRRKIILTTNIAETSLTIEGIDCVVDSGLTRKALYDVNSGMTRLQTQRVSVASAEQRRGRAGRLQAGVCYRLWSKPQQGQLEAFDAPEIEVNDLSGVCLELAQWGVHEPQELNWLTPPPARHFSRAQSLLQQLDLLDEKGRLSELGEQAMRFGSEPRLAKMLLSAQAEEPQNQRLACDLAAILSDRDIFRSGRADDPFGADLIYRVLALQAYRQNRKQACADYPLIASLAEQALKNSRNWQKQLGVDSVSTAEPSSEWLQHNSGRLVAQAFPDRLALRRGGQHTSPTRYQMANGKGAVLAENDALGLTEALAIAQIDGQAREGRVFLAAPLLREQIDALFAEHIESKAVYRYEPQRNEILGVQQRSYGALVLDEKPLPEMDESALQACLLEVIRQSKLKVLPWRESEQAWLNRVRWLAGHNSEWPSFEQAWLEANLPNWLGPFMNGIHSIKALQKVDLKNALLSLLDYEQQQELEQQAPEVYVTPSNKKVSIRYATGQNPTVSVQLQELFGELASPRLAWGQVPLTFELLSPARRPIQVTADLANFWQTSYFEIAKEMRGRYPKHRWPEKPLEEKAGRSIKARPRTR